MFDEIDDMEEMEELLKETWEDKFCEAVEDIQRMGFSSEGSEDDDNSDDDDDNGE